MSKIAINGLGRIGRATLKVIMEDKDLDLVAVNDLVPAKTLAYLLKYDTVYGRFPGTVEATGDGLVINGKTIKVFSEKDPAKLPWNDLGIKLVIESTGFFTEMDGAKAHLEAGAEHVIISAPTKSSELATVVHGVGHPEAQEKRIFSCASCTTNSITPVVEVMGRRIGIDKAILTTVHSYTSTQALVDSPSKKHRRGRAAAQNIVPSTTGAAVATTKVLPQHEGKFDGIALRVPTPVGSVSDIVFVASRATNVDEINSIFREEAGSDRYRDILAVSDDEIVSSDIIGDAHASIVDLTMTTVVDGNLVKVLAWYDNEWGYSNQMVREARSVLGIS